MIGRSVTVHLPQGPRPSKRKADDAVPSVAASSDSLAQHAGALGALSAWPVLSLFLTPEEIHAVQETCRLLHDHDGVRIMHPLKLGVAGREQLHRWMDRLEARGAVCENWVDLDCRDALDAASIERLLATFPKIHRLSLSNASPGDLEPLHAGNILQLELHNSSVDVASLPPELVRLRLADCVVAGAAEGIGALQSLEWLELERVAPNVMVAALAGLRTLALLRCPGTVKLAPQLACLKQLKHLRVEGSEGVAALLGAAPPNLESLALHCGVDALPGQPPALRRLQALSAERTATDFTFSDEAHADHWDRRISELFPGVPTGRFDYDGAAPVFVPDPR